MIGQTISHYKILEKLGEGGMGVVYAAEDMRLHRRVAIKFLASSSNIHHRSRFLREARAISALSHPHIAAIYDYGETDDEQPYIVMELVTGQTLSELIAESALTLSRAIEIIEEVAEALAEAHRLGIVHRDIKPSNVILDSRGGAKVLDFGLAKQLNTSTDGSEMYAEALTLFAATRTQSGLVVGTPLYLSPEQATGAAVDARSDVFALGTLLYECIAGRPAFSGASVIEIGAQVIHVNPPPPSSFNTRVPKQLDRIVLKALAKKPEARYQSAAEMLTDLHAARHALDNHAQHRTPRLANLSGAGLRTSALMTLSETLRRPRLSLASFMIALVVGALCLWGVVRLWRPSAHVATAEAQKWYDTGTDAMRDGSYYQASKALERAISSDDNFALAHARLSEAWMELDYTERAKDELLRVTTLVPERSVLPQLDALYMDGITSTVTRDYPRAITAYKEIARLAPDKPQVYVDLGRAYEKNEEVKKAIDSYVEATNRDPQYATAYLRVGYLYGRQQDLASATAAFDKADALYQALGNVEGRAETQYQRGYLFNSTGKMAEARAALQQALDLARATSNQYQQVKTLLQFGYVASEESNTAQAQSYAREAVEIAQANGFDNLTTRGLIDLGNTFLTSGDYTEAEKYFKQSLELARRQRVRRNEARALLSLGSLMTRQNKPDEAVRYVEQALPFYQQGNYRKETSQAFTLLARAMRQKGDYEAALQSLFKQLKLAQQVGDQLQEAFTHDDIGNALVEQEQYTKALDHFEESVAIAKTLGAQKSISAYALDRANVLWQLGRYEEAVAVLDQISPVVNGSENMNKRLSAWFHLIRARMALSQRRIAEAAEESKQALELAGTQINDTIGIAKCTLGLAQTFSGGMREGKQQCGEVFEAQQNAGSAWMISFTLLSFAETQIESGDAQGALTNALRAGEIFARSGQTDSEWHAWLIASRARMRTGDKTKAREAASRAADLLSSLEQKWGTDAYRSYLTRPDIQFSRSQLSQLLAVNP